jgi:hypothetical protein
LQYEEAVALKKLGHESQKETFAMYSLTVSFYKPKLHSSAPKTGQEQSTRDATAVKILTIIALIYLPTTIVAVSR